MRVAIVNDSRLATETLRRVIASDPRHSIAWAAADGAEGVRRCEQDRPDVVLMDLLMPGMNGAEATRLLMQKCPCAVLVVTSTVAGNFDLVCQALSHGAIDAICTPVLGGAASGQAGAVLLAKLETVERVNRHLTATAPLPGQAEKRAAKPDASRAPLPLVAIGVSTGGPAALEAILSRWPSEFPAAVLIAQHIGADFAPSLADWLGQRCPLRVAIASRGDRPTAGTVLLADGAAHLVLKPDHTLTYTAEPRDCPYCPSINALFHSLTAHWPWPAIAGLLTGIGRDGAQGLLELKQAGWHTIAQDEATSVVYGMPQAARQLGAARIVLPLDQIASHVVQRLSARGEP